MKEERQGEGEGARSGGEVLGSWRCPSPAPGRGSDEVRPERDERDTGGRRGGRRLEKGAKGSCGAELEPRWCYCYCWTAADGTSPCAAPAHLMQGNHCTDDMTRCVGSIDHEEFVTVSLQWYTCTKGMGKAPLYFIPILRQGKQWIHYR